MDRIKTFNGLFKNNPFKMNTRETYRDFNELPTDKMAEFIQHAAESEFDGYVFICTNGLTNPNGVNDKIGMLQSIKNPNVVSGVLATMALTYKADDMNRVLQLCKDLEDIARWTRDTILREVDRQKKDN